MKYQDRWKIIEEIGEGGQGKVYQVEDLLNPEPSPFNLALAIKRVLEVSENLADETGKSVKDAIELLHAEGIASQMQNSVKELLNANNHQNKKALKILHSPDKSRNYNDSEERLRRELKSMGEVNHPNVLKIEDSDLHEKWFVSKYYPAGTLQKNSDWFTGNIKRTLTAIRPIIQGVAHLHQKGIVHRDIKPENIFIDEKKQLVLGDFGLVFFSDRDRTRLSHTVENVGSHSWMPPWAINTRLENVNPNFDIFSLGKVIWSMISKTPNLLLWYHRKKEYDLQEMFYDPSMEFINRLLDKCVVENQEDCLTTATDLCAHVDNILHA